MWARLCMIPSTGEQATRARERARPRRHPWQCCCSPPAGLRSHVHAPVPRYWLFKFVVCVPHVLCSCVSSQINLSPTLLRLLDTAEFQRLRDLKQLGCAYLVFPGASHNRFEHSMGHTTHNTTHQRKRTAGDGTKASARGWRPLSRPSRSTTHDRGLSLQLKRRRSTCLSHAIARLVAVCFLAGVAHLAEQLLVHLRDTQPELNITPHDIQLVKMAGLCHDLGHGPFSHMFEEFVHAVNPKSEFRHERMSLQMLERIIKKVSVHREQARKANNRIGVEHGLHCTTLTCWFLPLNARRIASR